MKLEIVVLFVAAAAMFNAYHDGKYLKIVMQYKKYYMMSAYAFVGFAVYLFLKKDGAQGQQMLTNTNSLLKFLPVDRNLSSFLTPLLAQQKAESRILQPSQTTKRSVSETKKKFVAASQHWKCGECNQQLSAWFEVDHKVRLDNAGSNDVSNLVALCRECHGKKTAFENM